MRLAFALGGLGEVGKNTYVFEIDNKIFLVDAEYYFLMIVY